MRVRFVLFSFYHFDALMSLIFLVFHRSNIDTLRLLIRRQAARRRREDEQQGDIQLFFCQ